MLNKTEGTGKYSYRSLLPIYPLLAQQCADDYGLEEGICLDIGTGNGYVGTELAKITAMNIYYLDIDPAALDFARQSHKEADVDNKAWFVEADVCKELSFPDEFADFIISRGSFWFWEDKIKGLSEIYRVLKVGGNALIGGGLGRYIPNSMRKRLMAERKNMLEKQGVKRPSGKDMKDLAVKAGIPSFRIIKEAEQDSGGWIEIHKHI